MGERTTDPSTRQTVTTQSIQIVCLPVKKAKKNPHSSMKKNRQTDRRDKRMMAGLRAKQKTAAATGDAWTTSQQDEWSDALLSSQKKKKAQMSIEEVNR